MEKKTTTLALYQADENSISPPTAISLKIYGKNENILLDKENIVVIIKNKNDLTTFFILNTFGILKDFSEINTVVCNKKKYKLYEPITYFKYSGYIEIIQQGEVTNITVNYTGKHENNNPFEEILAQTLAKKLAIANYTIGFFNRKQSTK